MNSYLVIFISLLYLLLLFGIAILIERKSKAGKKLINNAYVYALSLTVYCTAWTYYGSVGRASTKGLDFSAIYIGPTICAILFVPMLSKLLRICKAQNFKSVADFVSARYGKNFSVASIVSIFYVLGLIPYIALQLKAISTSLEFITGVGHISYSSSFLLFDNTFFITLFLAGFIILFGTRFIDPAEKHEGLIAAISFEAIIKLVAFLCAGIFIVYVCFNGFGDVFAQGAKLPKVKELFTFNEANYATNWFVLILISMLAFFLLPRQFQVLVVENVKEKHLRKASWVLPLYLLLINIFVFPIAIAGKLYFSNNDINADVYVLALLMSKNQNLLTLFVFIGGISAATSMIITETIALSTMLSNNILTPIYLTYKNFRTDRKNSHTSNITTIRRLSIIIILLISYLFYETLAKHLSLVSIGLVSFVAVVQFAPAVIGGLYWKKANKKGAISGIVAGFLLWVYLLLLPITADAGVFEKKLFYLGFLNLQNTDPIVNAAIWSLFFNIVFFVFVSLNTKTKDKEILQAEMFVDFDKLKNKNFTTTPWSDRTVMADLFALLENFAGKQRAQNLIERYALRHNINSNDAKADARMIQFVEMILSGIVGSASANIMVRSIAKEEDIKLEEVLSILRESQQMIEMNKELRKKSLELEKAHKQLTEANAKLKDLDLVKDEFLYTVTHELRTPITSIRAMAEIIEDHPDMDEIEKNNFLHAMVREAERVTHLITQVLNLERYETGRQQLNYSIVNINDLIDENLQSVKALAYEKKITLEKVVPNSIFLVRADYDLLSQVLYNILTNAIKFSDNNSKIILHLQEQMNELQMSIADYGKGIPDQEKPNIFDKFFQARNQTLKKPTGSGLGLAISKKIIELHNGKISVEDNQPKGSRFIFTLPTE